MAARQGENTVIVVLILAFIASAVWMYYTFAKPADISPPRSTMSSRRGGCMALYELLERLDYPVERYGGTEYRYPEGGCVLLVDPSFTDPAMMMFESLNLKQVAGWIQEGGRLIIASEAEAMTMGYSLFEELDGRSETGLFDFDPIIHTNANNDGLAYPPEATAIYRIDGEEGRNQAMMREFMPGQRFELPEAKSIFWEDVQVFEVAKNDYYLGSSGVVLLASSPPSAPVVIYRKVGEGEVFWITCPELLTNDWLDRADNHRLVLTLVNQAARGSTIIFDEHIHGYRVESYNAGSLITRTRGGQLILLFIVAVALLFAGQAVRPAQYLPRPVPPRRQASEMVLAQADLYRRAKLVSNIARLLVDGLKRHYMREAHLSSPPPDRMLAEALREAGLHKGPGGAFLYSFLTGGVLPANPADLYKLAQGCYAAQGKL